MAEQELTPAQTVGPFFGFALPDGGLRFGIRPQGPQENVFFDV